MMILWKEWRQQWKLFVLGCAAGLILPIFEIVAYLDRDGTGSGSGIVGCFGAFFAILLAVGATHDDIRKGTDDFWQSKPLRAARLFTGKFFVGVVILLVSFLFVLSPDFITTYFIGKRFADEAWWVFYCTYPISLFLFTVTMFLMVILRDSAKAVLLAIWIGLLVYFLPFVVKGLGWLNIFEHFYYRNLSVFSYFFNNQPTFGKTFTEYFQYLLKHFLWQYLIFYIAFLVFMVGGSVVFLVLSVKGFVNKWRWQAGQKTIAWTLGISAAFIYGVSMMQAGHNLKPAKIHNGRELVSEINFIEPAKNNYDWTGQEVGNDYIVRRDEFSESVSFISNDLMFRINTAYQVSKTQHKERLEWEIPLKQSFFLDIYQLPYTKKDFHICQARFFVTPPVKKSYSQHVLGCYIKNNKLYAAYQPYVGQGNNPIHFVTIDVSNPERPFLVGEMIIKTKGNGAFAGHGDYCYLGSKEQFMVISLAEPDRPTIVKTIEYLTKFNYKEYVNMRYSLKKCVPYRHFSFNDNRMICSDSTRIEILDLSDPCTPKVVYDEDFSEKDWTWTSEIFAVALSNDLIYISTFDGLDIYQIIPQSNGKFSNRLIGRRKGTFIEKLAGRHSPSKLIPYGNLLIESSGFGVLIYDISEPTRPKRVYHGETESYVKDMGIWDGLIYTDNFGELVLFDIPKSK